MAFVYMLECSDGSYYVGSTRSLELRVFQHNSDRDGSAYTRARRPVVLVWHAEVEHIGPRLRAREADPGLGTTHEGGVDPR